MAGHSEITDHTEAASLFEHMQHVIVQITFLQGFNELLNTNSQWPGSLSDSCFLLESVVLTFYDDAC